MPEYEYRCKDCGRRFSLRYSTFRDYDEARPSVADSCASTALTRIITQVAIQTSNRDYSRMSTGEMLSVLESGDQRQVETLFQQVGAASGQPSSSDSDDNEGGRAAKHPHPKADRAKPKSPSGSDRR